MTIAVATLRGCLAALALLSGCVAGERPNSASSRAVDATPVALQYRLSGGVPIEVKLGTLAQALGSQLIARQEDFIPAPPDGMAPNALVIAKLRTAPGSPWFVNGQRLDVRVFPSGALLPTRRTGVVFSVSPVDEGTKDACSEAYVIVGRARPFLNDAKLDLTVFVGMPQVAAGSLGATGDGALKPSVQED